MSDANAPEEPSPRYRRASPAKGAALTFAGIVVVAPIFWIMGGVPTMMAYGAGVAAGGLSAAAIGYGLQERRVRIDAPADVVAQAARSLGFPPTTPDGLAFGPTVRRGVLAGGVLLEPAGPGTWVTAARFHLPALRRRVRSATPRRASPR